MSRSALGLFLALALATSAAGATPRAVIRGPARVDPDGTINLTIAGSVYDAEPTVEFADGPERIDVVPAYTRDGKLAFATAVAHQGGRYTFALVAEGTPDGAKAPVRAYGFATVDVRPALPPAPTPAPTPDTPVVPTPAPVVPDDPTRPGVTIGRAYAPQLLETYAAAWEKGATQVAAGLSSADVAATFGPDWQKARTDLFNRVLKPELNRVLPEGAPIADQAQRDAVAKLWRDVATGLRGAIR
jgi:hypothetical protein